MAAYQKIPEQVEAVQFLGFWDGVPRFSETLAWVEEALKAPQMSNGWLGTTDGYLSLMTRASYQFANPTDWVVKMNDCDLFLMKDEGFRRLYEPKPDQQGEDHGRA